MTPKSKRKRAEKLREHARANCDILSAQIKSLACQLEKDASDQERKEAASDKAS